MRLVGKAKKRLPGKWVWMKLQDDVWKKWMKPVSLHALRSLGMIIGFWWLSYVDLTSSYSETLCFGTRTKIQLPLISSPLVSLKQRPYLSSNVTVESSAMLPWAAKYHKTVGWFWDSVGLLLRSGLFSRFIGRHRCVQMTNMYIIYSITLQINSLLAIWCY